MNPRELVCIIIRHANHRHQSLEKVLRAGDFPVRVQFADNLGQLKAALTRQPMILFFHAAGQEQHRPRLVGLLQRLAPDCILASVMVDQWQGLSSSRSGDIDICSIASRDPVQFRQQIDYLLAYARLKNEFRQCKHLLSIAELRSQWLVDYAREAVAYVAKGRHLHVNIAYLSLFGFHSEAEALATSVLQLVQPDERAIFEPLSLEAEQRAAPSNKLLMTLRDRNNKPFRAELRFIPSVFRGRRCIQLHIHPLLRQQPADEALGSLEADTQLNDPWQQPTLTARHKGNSSTATQLLPAQPTPVHTPATVGSQPTPHFRELLNLCGSAQPALLLAVPYLNSQGLEGRPWRYEQLLAKAKTPEARCKLDMWNIRTSQQFLIARRHRPIKQQVWVSVGDWVFREPTSVRHLLESLLKTRAVNGEIVLGVDYANCLQFKHRAVKIQQVLHETGVSLGLENVPAAGQELELLLRLTQAKRLRTKASLLAANSRNAAIPDAIKQLLEQADTHQIAVIVDGVDDLNTLNLLCDTTAGYLHGPILDKLSR